MKQQQQQPVNLVCAASRRLVTLFGTVRRDLPSSSSFTSLAAFSPSSRRFLSIILDLSAAALSSALTVQPMAPHARPGFHKTSRTKRGRASVQMPSGCASNGGVVPVSPEAQTQPWAEFWPTWLKSHRRSALRLQRFLRIIWVLTGGYYVHMDTPGDVCSASIRALKRPFARCRPGDGRAAAAAAVVDANAPRNFLAVLPRQLGDAPTSLGRHVSTVQLKADETRTLWFDPSQLNWMPRRRDMKCGAVRRGSVRCGAHSLQWTRRQSIYTMFL